jgi:four helix bundle protein
MSDLRKRTKEFAVAVFRLCDSLPDTPSCRVVRRQLTRSASSVGANYRAACHARSKAEFLSKMSIVEEEADETEYWLELLDEVGAVPREQVRRFRDEAHQITSMVIASIKTARRKQ